jgi:hypothetical protein
VPEKPTAKSRRPRRVSIASGASVPQIDLDALLRERPSADSVAGAGGVPRDGAAMTGGGAQAATAGARDTLPRPSTVSLPDGTRITFAAADWVRTLETA